MLSASVYLQPANIEEELQQSEDRQIEVLVVTWVALGRVQELPTNQTSQEEAVHGHGHHLIIRQQLGLGAGGGRGFCLLQAFFLLIAESVFHCASNCTVCIYWNYCFFNVEKQCD